MLNCHGWRISLLTSTFSLTLVALLGCQAPQPLFYAAAPRLGAASEDPALANLTRPVADTSRFDPRLLTVSYQSDPPNANPPGATTPNANQPNVGSPDHRGDERGAGRPEPLPVPGRVEPIPAEANRPLALQDVVISVRESYPMLAAAVFERDVTLGQLLSAWGEYDLQVKAFGIAAPEGFYQTYRNAVGLTQPVFRGGYVYGGYKFGDGNFQPWFKERETNEGGEFSAGFGVPLLKDRQIDKRRLAVFQADLARQAVEPSVQAQLLEFTLVASQTYWEWVAAGQGLEAQRELLDNAKQRIEQIQKRVEAGDLRKITRINNEQLLASREAKLIEAERKLQKAAIKLSLFFRSLEGQPVVPDPSRLPSGFPKSRPISAERLETDIAEAIAASPLLRSLDLEIEQQELELENARNMLLPKLDARLTASKDVGAPASSKRDKTPFELEAGLFAEVPLQRSNAQGKITSVQGKLAQLNAKRRFVVDKITISVRDAMSALLAAAGRIELATTNEQLARETLRLGRLQFDAGDIDLVTLNLYEKSVTDARLLLIAAQADFFIAEAAYRAALSRMMLGDER